MYYCELNIARKLRNHIARGVIYHGPLYRNALRVSQAGTLTMELDQQEGPVQAVKLSVRLHSTPSALDTGVWAYAPFTDTTLAMAIGESAGFALARNPV